jgi:hypothetical protein
LCRWVLAWHSIPVIIPVIACCGASNFRVSKKEKPQPLQPFKKFTHFPCSERFYFDVLFDFLLCKGLLAELIVLNKLIVP